MTAGSSNRPLTIFEPTLPITISGVLRGRASAEITASRIWYCARTPPVTVHHVARVVDVERHGRRFGRIAAAVNGDHGTHHARQFAGRRRVLPSAHSRLTGKTRSRTRQLAERQAEARIIAQRIEVVGILVTTGDRQYPLHPTPRRNWLALSPLKLQSCPQSGFS